MLRLTRRNLLLVLLSVSVVGLFVYSRIGSRAKILRGTSLISERGNFVHESKQNGQRLNRKGAGMRRKDTASEVSQHPQESSAEGRVPKGKTVETEKSLDSKEQGGKEPNEGIRISETEEAVDAKEIVIDEGFFREKHPEDVTEEDVDVANVDNTPKERDIDHTLPQSSAKPVGNVTTETVTKNETNSPAAKIMTERTGAKPYTNVTKSPPKPRVVKIGWTRDREEWRPGGNERPGNVTSKPVVEVITSHYFAENPIEAPKAKKTFQKCLSKLSEQEKNSFLEWEHSYRKSLPLSVNPMSIGQRWIALARYMQTLGREQRLPNVINIGAKKSGTTALGWFITMHPQISHAFGNEVHFFDKQYDKGLDFYKSRMGFAKHDQLVFEKTPRYLVTDSMPGHALKDLPAGVKFIICIRDPLKRALSDFRHDSTLQIRRQARDRMNRQIIAARSPESEGARFAAGAFDKYGNVNSSFDSVRTSSYVKHFKNWLSFFPRDRFLIVDHQKLVDNAFHELHRIEVFLGLTPYFQSSMFYFDKTRHGTCVKGREYPCPPRSSPGWLPAGQLTVDQERRLRDYFRPLNREFVQLVGDHNFTWVEL